MAYANIHEFAGECMDGFGDPMIGFYYRIYLDDGNHGDLMGPYLTREMAAEHAQLAFDQDDI